MTIAEAAAEVIRSKGRPLSIDEILEGILQKHLYEFNSPDQLAILREQVRRHCELPDKALQYSPILFTQTRDSKYQIMEQAEMSKVISYRRIRRAKDKELLIEKLTKKGESRFGDIWRLMFFACCLGIHRSTKEPVTEFDAGKSIDFSYFGGTPAWPGFIHLLGLVEVDDPRILNPDQDKIDQRIQCFEEYANGGMSIMLREMEGRDFTLDSILSLLPPAIISSDSGELATQI